MNKKKIASGVGEYLDPPLMVVGPFIFGMCIIYSIRAYFDGYPTIVSFILILEGVAFLAFGAIYARIIRPKLIQWSKL